MNNLPVVRSPWRIAILIIGFTFLYAPMLMLGGLVHALVQRAVPR